MKQLMLVWNALGFIQKWGSSELLWTFFLLNFGKTISVKELFSKGLGINHIWGFLRVTTWWAYLSNHLFRNNMLSIDCWRSCHDTHFHTIQPSNTTLSIPLSTLTQHALAQGHSVIVPISLFGDCVAGTLSPDSLTRPHTFDCEFKNVKHGPRFVITKQWFIQLQFDSSQIDSVHTPVLKICEYCHLQYIAIIIQRFLVWKRQNRRQKVKKVKVVPSHKWFCVFCWLSEHICETPNLCDALDWWGWKSWTDMKVNCMHKWNNEWMHWNWACGLKGAFDEIIMFLSCFSMHKHIKHIEYPFWNVPVCFYSP